MATKREQSPQKRKILMVLGLTIATAMPDPVRAGEEVAMPEGMLGWWYFISALPETKFGYAKSAAEACAATAANHFQSPLYFMTPSSGGKPAYHCGYKHNWINRVETYSPTQLVCKTGYSPRWPGVCTKWVETPQPPTCSNEEPGKVEANPVVVSSGAKLQSETDFPGLQNGALRITRTYL